MGAPCKGIFSHNIRGHAAECCRELHRLPSTSVGLDLSAQFLDCIRYKRLQLCNGCFGKEAAQCSTAGPMKVVRHGGENVLFASL